MHAAPPIHRDDLNEAVARVGPLWDELRGARILITGGTGFFGAWLLETLLAAEVGARITVPTRRPALFAERMPHLANRVKLVEADVREAASLPRESFTHIVHAATDASAKLNAERPLEMLDTIVSGTRNVLELARECGAKRVLLTSSGAVYGRQPSELTHVGEDYRGGPDPLDVNSAYAQGKVMAEHLCAIYAAKHGVASVIGRCFAFVGPHLPLDAHFAIGNFIGDALNGRTIRVNGDGTPMRSYLYAGDLAAWLWTLLLAGKPGRAYNVGSDEAISIAELARRIGGRYGVGVEIAKAATAGAAIARYVPSIARARQELGLEVRVGLDEAIERTMRWHRARR